MIRRSMLLLTATGLLLAPSVSAQTGPVTTTTSSLRASLFSELRPAVFKLEHQGDGGHGTGFFINPDGLALTAYHVVYGATTLTARTLDGRTFPVDVIGYDEQQDTALLRVRVGSSVPFLPLAPQSPRVGDAVLAIGNSGREFLDDERGVLRALDVAAGRADFPSGTLELDAPLRPGDSGGPIINAKGEAVGVTSYIRAVSGSDFRSYAVPVTQSSALVRDLQAGVKRDAPVLGVRGVAEISDAVAREAGLAVGGVVFQEVARGGPAEQAGLRALRQVSPPSERQRFGVLGGDVITAVDGRRVRDVAELMAVVRARQVGETVELTVQRDGQARHLSVKLGGSAQVFTSQR